MRRSDRQTQSTSVVAFLSRTPLSHAAWMRRVCCVLDDEVESAGLRLEHCSPSRHHCCHSFAAHSSRLRLRSSKQGLRGRLATRVGSEQEANKLAAARGNSCRSSRQSGCTCRRAVLSQNRPEQQRSATVGWKPSRHTLWGCRLARIVLQASSRGDQSGPDFSAAGHDRAPPTGRCALRGGVSDCSTCEGGR